MRIAKTLAPVLATLVKIVASKVGEEFQCPSSPVVEVWIAGQVAFGNMTMADAIFTMGDTF